MQTSGAMRRENAMSDAAVIAREGGRSSIPETSMIESIGRSVLDTPPSRGMTVVVLLRHFTVIASAAKQSIVTQRTEGWIASLRSQ